MEAQLKERATKMISDIREQISKIRTGDFRNSNFSSIEKGPDKYEIRKEVEKQTQKIKSDIEEQYLKQLTEKEEENLKKEKLATELRDKVISLQDDLLEEASRSEYNHQKFLEKKSKIDSIKVKLNNFINLPEGIDNQRGITCRDIMIYSHKPEIQQGPDYIVVL